MEKKRCFSRLLLENKVFLKHVILISILILFEIILTISLSYLLKEGIDFALLGGEGYTKFIYGLIGVIVLFSLTIYLKDLTVGFLSEGAIADLRYNATQKIAKLPIGKLDTMHSGDNLSKLTNDIQIVKGFLDRDGYFLISRPLMAVTSLTYLIYLSWQLALASVILIPVMIHLTVTISKPLGSYSKALQEELANINKTNQDILGGIQVVKSFNLKDRILLSFKEQVDESIERGRIIAIRRAVLSGVSVTLNFLPFLMPLALGSYLITQELMSVGELLAFINLMNNLTWPIAQLPNHFGIYKSAIASLERIYEVVDMEPERETGEVYALDAEEIISFKNIRFSYKKREILSNLCFTVDKGEKVALVGPSGGGKSTIFKLITGFYSPASGEVCLFNNPIDSWKLDALRREIAVVSQDTYLFPMSIKENIALGKVGSSMEEIIAAAQKANAHNFIMGLPEGYETTVGERGTRLSGGQKQRISIARAILKDARLLLLDEATSALDTESELLVQQALEQAMLGRTTMIIAHRLSTIINTDRILVIEDGTVVEDGSHEELLQKNGVYSKLYRKDIINDESESGVA